MARTSTSGFATVRTAGGLLPMELLERIARGEEGGLVSSEAYHLTDGVRLKDAISQSFARMVGAWKGFVAARDQHPADDPLTSLTREKWLLPLFAELGYGRLPSARGVEASGRSWPVSHVYGTVPIHLCGWRIDLDERAPGAGAARTSPHGLVQELLNVSDDRLWGFLGNGRRLRILRDSKAMTREAYVEFDLEAMMEGELFSDFALLWLLAHQSRVEGVPPETCVLEAWAQEGAKQGVRALDHLRDGVERAIEALGAGFLAHPRNADLREKLRQGRLGKQDYFRQVLRVVYRLLFLFVAEDRDLLHLEGTAEDARRLYRDWYSTARLRRLSGRIRGGRHPDLWQGLALVMRRLHDQGSPHLGLPALGSFLWSPDAIRDLDGCDLANRDLLAAVHPLAFHEDGGVRRPIDYRSLGAEELGSVYESLLELHPDLNLEAATFSLTSAAGHERKTTGSYYTPSELIFCLLDSALEPVLDAAIAGRTRAEAERRLLALRVVDPACGSGHFLIAAAHRIAKRLARIRAGEDEPAPPLQRAALRDVVGRCLYGVDINPMSLELAKVALWMEAIEPGKPLSYLDHHLHCGNALLGVPLPRAVEEARRNRAGRIAALRKDADAFTARLNAQATGEEEANALDDQIKDLRSRLKDLESAPTTDHVPDEAFQPIEGDDRAFSTELRRRNKKERTQGQGSLLGYASLAADAEDFTRSVRSLEAFGDASLAAVREKESRHRSVLASPRYLHEKLVADAWCSAFVWPKTSSAALAPTDAIYQGLRLDPVHVSAVTRQEINRLAGVYRFFHWHLAFPEVFGDSGSAGFDVVLGNPPWERIKLQDQEFFAERRPEIAAAPNKAAREAMIAKLEGGDPPLWRAYHEALRQAEGESVLVRETGRFPLTGRGDVNTYAIFTETMRSLLSPAGRVGCIVPSGIATDDTTKYFFQELMEKGCLVSLYDFRNKGFFPDVAGAQGNRFCLLTFRQPTEQRTAEIFFRGERLSDLSDHQRRFSLSSDDIALINPNTRTCPVFRTRQDAELTKSVYRRVPVLISEGPSEENPWGMTVRTRLWHMAEDSELLRTREQLQTEGWTLRSNHFHKAQEVRLPLYEAKMIHHFDHRFGDYALATLSGKEVRQIPQAEANVLADPTYSPLPRYWVPASDVTSRLADHWSRDWLLGWRDITSALDERTVIASILPRVGVGHTMPLFLPKSASPDLIACFYANLCSFAFDFVARQKVGGTHLTYVYLKQLPVLPPATYAASCPWSPSETVGEWLLPRVLELTYTAHDLAAFARDCGFTGPPFRFDAERRFRIRCELDAAFFHLYGLSADDTSYILDTFPIVRRHDFHLHGSYRTKDMILRLFSELAATRIPT